MLSRKMTTAVLYLLTLEWYAPRRADQIWVSYLAKARGLVQKVPGTIPFVQSLLDRGRLTVIGVVILAFTSLCAWLGPSIGFFFSGYSQTAGLQQTLVTMDKFASIVNKSDEGAPAQYRTFNNTADYTAANIAKQKLLIRVRPGATKTERESLLDLIRYLTPRCSLQSAI
jgi:hypothetical protein